jgi:serine/threonine-protein kinase RsbW
MTPVADISVEARLDNLPPLLQWLERACEDASVSDDVTFSLQLAVEEVCANLIRHGYGPEAAGPIRLSFAADARLARVIIEDEAATFDPADAPAPDLQSDWEDRRVGGLGWHLVFQLMDEVSHEPRPERGNRITLTKRRTMAAGQP